MDETVAKSEQVVVPVLGMHRSGTSMFSRMLSLLGLDLGSNLLGPGRNNKSGYWEDRELMAASQAFVMSAGCDWRGFAPSKTLFDAFEKLRSFRVHESSMRRLSRYLDSQFTGSHWGWKDPRAMLTLPMWLKSLQQLGYRRFRPIVIVRDPVQCASSVAKVYSPGRSNEIVSKDTALQIWTDYHQILESYREDEWPVVLHNDLLDSALAEPVLRRCCDWLGLRPAAYEPALEWVDTGLLSQVGADEDFQPDGIYDSLAVLARRQQAEFDSRSR